MLTDNPFAPHILVVEDDDNHAELIKRSFEDDLEEFRLEFVSTVYDAKKAMEGRSPGLILTDYRLPDGDGSELVATAAESLPVIIMTSQGSEQIAVEVMKSGAQDYIVKSPESFGIMPRTVSFALKSWLLIQARRQADEAVIRAKRDWERTFDAVPDLLSIIDINHTIIRVNKGMAERCGLTVQEIVGRKCYEAVHGLREAPACCPRFDMKQDDFVHIKEIEVNRLNGVFDITISPLTDEKGRITSYAHVMRDVTERKKVAVEKLAVEQQLQQGQKLESLGVLAGGIAHDFNNILAVIMCNCSLAKQRPKLADELITEIESAAHRAADLCRQMLAYAGKAMSTITQVNMTALVDDMVKMLRSTLNQKVVIKHDLSPEVPSIRADASQIRQIVMNLIINASEAIGEAPGEIRVSLTKTEIHAGQPDKDHLGKIITAGRYVCLEVSDNGCGMDDETRQRVFEPFYTTKFTGRGLGLSAVLGIITAHKGAMQVSSQPGQGSTFKVYLSVQGSDSAGDESLPPVAPAPWQGNGTILLVEDEPQLMLIAKTLLNELGFSVFEATNGKEAVELYRKNAECITLVVTDIGMPVMDGYELIRELKIINPDLPIIISSGFGDMDVTSQIAEGKVAGYLSKPYSFNRLREVMKGVVEKQAEI